LISGPILRIFRYFTPISEWVCHLRRFINVHFYRWWKKLIKFTQVQRSILLWKSLWNAAFPLLYEGFRKKWMMAIKNFYFRIPHFENWAWILFLFLERRIFCMLRNTRWKLMNILFHLVYIFQFFIFDTSLKRQTILKSMYSALSVKLC
jgi:hypothetical protein